MFTRAEAIINKLLEQDTDLTDMVDGVLDLSTRMQQMLEDLNKRVNRNEVKAVFAKAVSMSKELDRMINSVRDNVGEEGLEKVEEPI
jgi:GH25 family lysozyme M1 (1,4-beta-N-acetylmuramidase)